MLRMNRNFLPILFLLLLPAFAGASITVTPASGGSAISADTAGIGGSGTWTTLGAITISEAKKSDIGSGVASLVLKAPAGFEFNTASTPSISWASGQDITAATILVSDSSTLTISLTVSGTSGFDTLVIGNTGLQIRPTLGGPVATGKHIYRPTSGGGNASLSGVTSSSDGSSGSNFGTLT